MNRTTSALLCVAGLACNKAPTDAQVADVRARFERADEADREPDRAFRAALAAARTLPIDESKPCGSSWAMIDRETFFGGLGRWSVEMTDKSLQATLMQFDGVSIAGRDVATDTVGSATRKRRRDLESKLLAPDRADKPLSAKDFLAQADAIEKEPLANELFIHLDVATDAKADPTGREKFSGGLAAGRAYLFDQKTQRFICAGTFSAESSDTVRGRLGTDATAKIDFYQQIVGAAKDSLHAL